jgi:hypothetical protein
MLADMFDAINLLIDKIETMQTSVAGLNGEREELVGAVQGLLVAQSFDSATGNLVLGLIGEGDGGAGQLMEMIMAQLTAAREQLEVFRANLAS